MLNTFYSSVPRIISPKEAMWYYRGLPSNPKLVYRTGSEEYKIPAGPEAYPVRKELRPVFGHKLHTVWNDVAPKIQQFLDSLKVWWTSIDVVSFKDVGTNAIGPVVLWIGVFPDTLFGETAHIAAYGCLDLLKEFAITDINVEFRESIYIQSADSGPALLKAVDESDPTVDVRTPLTPTLGLSIAARNTPQVKGTGGIYLAEGGDSNKVLLVTARHILFPSHESLNVDYSHTNTRLPRREVLLFGTDPFNQFTKSIKDHIKNYVFTADLYKRQIINYRKTIEELKVKVDSGDKANIEKAVQKLKQNTELLEKTQGLLRHANEAMPALDKFHDEALKEWRAPSKRVIGHVLHSPPITFGAGAEGFTEDYGVVELDRLRFKEAFMGNVIDLGTKISIPTFSFKMSSPDFIYPFDRLLQLQDIISEDQMRNPDTVDCDDLPYLPVIKSGIATDVTIGRATGIFSFVRQYFENNTHHTSKEWAILPYDETSRAFSACGDSGSIVVDEFGRIGGLITGGAGEMDSLDITYATPFYWLLSRIRANGFPDAHIYPVIDEALQHRPDDFECAG